MFKKFILRALAPMPGVGGYRRSWPRRAWCLHAGGHSVEPLRAVQEHDPHLNGFGRVRFAAQARGPGAAMRRQIVPTDEIALRFGPGVLQSKLTHYPAQSSRLAPKIS